MTMYILSAPSSPSSRMTVLAATAVQEMCRSTRSSVAGGSTAKKFMERSGCSCSISFLVRISGRLLITRTCALSSSDSIAR